MRILRMARTIEKIKNFLQGTYVYKPKEKEKTDSRQKEPKSEGRRGD